MTVDKAAGRIIVLIPVFNDWQSVGLLLRKLDKAVPAPFDIIVIDDASTESSQTLELADFKNVATIRILELKRNLGHQRAIALGLSYTEANLDCKAIVVMDGDGEDDPSDVPVLINKCASDGFSRIIFARRTQRSERLLFKFFYILYRNLYGLLTGYEIRMGNFSIIPGEHLRRLVVVSEIWNHYAAGVSKSKLPYAEIGVRRGRRLAGKPKMNFVSLVTHGLSAISVHGEAVGSRLLIASCFLMIVSILAILTAVIIRFTTSLAIPGWTTYVVGIFLLVLVQSVILSLFFIFIVLSGRNNIHFIPQRDYSFFILECKQVYTCPTHTLAANSTYSAEPPNGRLTTEDFSKNI